MMPGTPMQPTFDIHPTYEDRPPLVAFETVDAFQQALAALLDCPPEMLTAPGGALRADWISTPLGAMIAVGDDTHLHLLEFSGRRVLSRELERLSHPRHGGIRVGPSPAVDQTRQELEAYFAGRSAIFTTPLALHGTPFYRQVWRALLEIPPGTTCSYGELARRIGNPKGVRAVAQANGSNQIGIVIPCHRVIGSDGKMTGYGGGLWRKKQLIALEQAYAPPLFS